MNNPAMAREDLQLLRQTIAKIEKKQIATFDSPVSLQGK
jgi:protein ImuA